MTTHQQTGSIQFLMGNSTEVLRISKDGITVNPDVPVNEIAQTVLEALEGHLNILVQRAVEAEREACIRACDTVDLVGADECIAAIRARGEK